MRSTWAVVALWCIGCGGSDGAGGQDAAARDLAAPLDPLDMAVPLDPLDMAVPLDLAGPQPDLAIPPRDLAIPPYDGAVACTPPATGTRVQYVWNTITLPMNRAEYALDLNGDGRGDNQLGNVEGAIDGQMLEPQGDADQAIHSGQSITLFDERSSDATFANDDCASSNVVAGQTMAAPDFSGAGHFSVDPTATVGQFSGPIVASRFTAEPPPYIARVPSVVRLNLPIFGVVSVEVVAAHITYLRTAAGGAMHGQLNGAIRQHDIEHSVVPQLAKLLTARVQANPPSPKWMDILAIFDNGGRTDPACAAGTCKNLDGSCAIKGDGSISDCEVGTSGLLHGVLTPDVQLFDAAGNYHPNPDNDRATKDSLSIGVAFTAVPATF